MTKMAIVLTRPRLLKKLAQGHRDNNAQNPGPYAGHVRSWHAWGHKGHGIIAQIAEDHLTSQTRKALRKLMGSDDIVQYATWADDIRHERPEIAPWHYVDIPGDSSGYDAHRDCPESDCIVAKITEFSAILRDSTPVERTGERQSCSWSISPGIFTSQCTLWETPGAAITCLMWSLEMRSADYILVSFTALGTWG
jgi:hypothetical protein